MSKYEGTHLESASDKIKRRRALNEALMVQALSPSKGTQMVGDRAIYDPWSGIAKVGKAVMGAYGNKKADKDEEELEERYTKNRKESISKITDLLTGKPETPYKMSPDEQFDNEQIPGLKNAAVEPDPMKAALTWAEDPFLKGDPNLAAAMVPKATKKTFKTIPKALESGQVQDMAIENGVPTEPWGVPHDPRTQKTNVNVAVDTGAKDKAAMSKKYNEVLGSGYGEMGVNRLKAANQARTANVDIDRALLAIARGAKTGLGEEFILGAKSMAQTLGWDIGNPEEMAEQEIIRALGSKSAMQMRSTQQGGGLPGSTSNKDLVFMRGATYGLGKTEAGNIKLMELMKRQNKMIIAMEAEQLRIIREEEPGKPAGVAPIDMESRLFKFGENYEFFKEGEREEIEALIAGVKPAAGDTTDFMKSLDQKLGISP